MNLIGNFKIWHLFLLLITDILCAQDLKKCINVTKDLTLKFQNAQTDLQFAESFFKLYSEKQLSSKCIEEAYIGVYGSNNTLFEDNIKKELNGITILRLEWVEEGTRPYFMFNWDTLLAVASKTKGENDDNYIRLQKEIFGKKGELHYNVPAWLCIKGDIFASSKMGNGDFTYFIKSITKFSDTDKLFVREYNQLRIRLFQDITSYSYEYSKGKVLKEMHKILKIKGITDKEKQIVNDVIKEMNNNDSKYQFDCKTQNCNFG